MRYFNITLLNYFIFHLQHSNLLIIDLNFPEGIITLLKLLKLLHAFSNALSKHIGFSDPKHPVGSTILKKQGQNKTLREMAYDLGEAISDQKKRFCGLEQGPRSKKNVLHIVDLCYVPTDEKQIVKELCLKGAGSSKGILFLNTE